LSIKRPFLTLLIFTISLALFPGCRETVKEPSVAGAFYPAEKQTLSKWVDDFLARAEENNVEGRLIALIAPHAGYRYSGAVAGYTYKHLQNKDIKTVILIGPSHYASFRGASVYAKGSWKTPLGKVKIDSDIAGSLINKTADVTFFPDAFEKEHSLEVQVPFIQRLSKRIKIVPILIGTPTRESFHFLTSRLVEIMKNNRKTIIIASTDFSHYHDYDTAVSMDMTTIDAIERMSIEDIQKYIMSRKGEMCGSNPVIFTMAVARNLGATNSVLFKYANSGDVTGDNTRVVGYAAMGLYESPLTSPERKELLDLARMTIKSYVTQGKTPEINIKDKRLRANGATFVTIKTEKGMLRGCMGNIKPIMPLYSSVIENAVSACARDPRFHPLTPGELDDIEVEVTVLSPLEPLKDTESIEIGRHGLYIVKDNRSGLLLPQVPVESGWDRETFLKQVSKKAGLPQDSWKEANLYRFTADIIR
jgi:AmmeMemoRadiSam system protein B/AmmeMemoRadiSam system protein A